MVIKADFKEFDECAQLITSVVNNKSVKEDAKNIIVWGKSNEIKLVGYSMQVACTTILKCTEVEGFDEEKFIAFKVKDINDILGAFRSLKKTYVSEVEIEITDNKGCEMVVHEEPLPCESEDDEKFADKYRKSTRFKLKPVPMTESRKNEIILRMADSDDDKWEEMNVAEAGIYINTLLPVTGSDERGVNNFSNKINFANGKAYAIPLTHGIIMTNVVGVLDNILFTNSMLAFLRNMMGNGGEDCPYVEVSKHEEGDLVLIKVRRDDTIASIKTYTGAKCFKLKDVKMPNDGVITDKEYLCDVIRRMSLAKGDVKFKINISEGSFIVESDSMTQEIPVLQTKGEGEFEFSLSPQIMGSMILSHTNDFMSKIFIYLEHNDKGKVNMVVTDASKIEATGEKMWYSYIENMSVKGVATKW